MQEVISLLLIFTATALTASAADIPLVGIRELSCANEWFARQ
jgi:hypothetical protein